MKALTLEVTRSNWDSTRGYELRDVAEPILNETIHPADADSVIVEPILTGFCGTDKSIWFRKGFKDSILSAMETQNRPYLLPGHELLGKIVGMGSNVEQAGKFTIGQVVSTESHLYCGTCHACRVGEYHVCTNDLIIGVTTDGCFAEKLKLPANVLWPTNLDKIRPEVAAIQEPFGNAVHVCTPHEGKTLKDKNVAVFGCGTIGLFTIMIAKAMGARKIIGIDPNEKAQGKAMECGADKVIAPSNKTAAIVRSFFNDYGGRCVFRNERTSRQPQCCYCSCR